MKIPRLSLLLCLPFLALSLRAQPDDSGALSTTTYSGVLRHIWTPYDSVVIDYGFRFVELFPSPKENQRFLWKSPDGSGHHAPEQTGNSISTEQTYKWTLPGREGGIQLVRSVDAQTNRLVARETWTCEPTQGAFTIREIQIDLSKYPNCILSLIEPVDPQTTVRYPNLTQAIAEKRPIFSSGPRALAKGFRLDGIGGGYLTITTPSPITIQPARQPSSEKGSEGIQGPQIYVFRMSDTGLVSPENLPTLTSGSCLVIIDWHPAGS